jgi:hypothetical protein
LFEFFGEKFGQHDVAIITKKVRAGNDTDLVKLFYQVNNFFFY